MTPSTRPLFMAACLAASPLLACDLEDDLDSEQLELIESPETDESYETLHLLIPTDDPDEFVSCSAIAITDRWILTAAHCVDDLDDAPFELEVCSGECNVDPSFTGREVIYDGLAEPFVHPDWEGDSGDNGDDMALVLLHGAGMPNTPRGRFYSDSRTPWYDPYPYSVPMKDRIFHIIGYGRGSDPGGPSCDADPADLTIGVKRIREGNYFIARDYKADSVQSGGDGAGTCKGDSGSPWFVSRGGIRLAFAIHSGREDFWIWDDSKASLIPNKWSWIVSTTAAGGLPIECHSYATLGYQYKMCEDDPVFVRLDAEYGTRSGPMTIGTDKFASQAKYVWVPNGAGTDGRLTYVFSVPRTARYHVWARVLTASSADNEFRVRIDLGPEDDWETPVSSSWLWHEVGDGYALGEGTHSISLFQEEDGAKVDRFIITTAGNWRPWELWLEAEWGSLAWPMRSLLGIGGNYITVPNGAGAGGAAYYSFGIQTPGQYHIWGLAESLSGADDSFFVTVDDGARLLWDTPIGTDWIWDRVSHRGAGDATYNLGGGWHTLDIERREDGTRLDRILITNDLGFVPKHTSPVFKLPKIGSKL